MWPCVVPMKATVYLCVMDTAIEDADAFSMVPASAVIGSGPLMGVFMSYVPQ